MPYNELLKEISDFVNPLMSEIVTKARKFDFEMEGREERAYTGKEITANVKERERFATELHSSYSEQRQELWGKKLDEFRAKFEALPFPPETEITKDYPDIALNRQYNVPLDLYIGLDYPDMALIPTYTNPKVPITAKFGSPVVWLPGALMEDLKLRYKNPIKLAWEGNKRKLKMKELVRSSESEAGYLESNGTDGRGFFWSQSALKNEQEPAIRVPTGKAGFHYDFFSIRNAYFSPSAIGSGEIDALLEHLKLTGKPAVTKRE